MSLNPAQGEVYSIQHYVIQWLATCRWYPLVSSINKTDRHNITEILLKVALNTKPIIENRQFPSPSPRKLLSKKYYTLAEKIYPRCVCGHLFEDSIHFFLDCPLYQHDRTSLFNYFNNIVPISIEYILFGCNEISEELNTLLFKSVQKFIRQTCRFNN